SQSSQEHILIVSSMKCLLAGTPRFDPRLRCSFAWPVRPCANMNFDTHARGKIARSKNLALSRSSIFHAAVLSQYPVHLQHLHPLGSAPLSRAPSRIRQPVAAERPSSSLGSQHVLRPAALRGGAGGVLLSVSN